MILRLHLRLSRSALLASCLLIALLTVLCVLTWRMWKQDKLDQALLAAIGDNAPSTVISLLAQGANANAGEIQSEPSSLMQRLLQRWHGGPTLPENRVTALQAACLAHYQDFSDPHPLTDPAIVLALLDHGAHVNFHFRNTRMTETPLSRITWLLCTWVTPAEKRHYLVVAHRLLDKGANPNLKADFLPLTNASQAGDASLITHLLHCGAKMNAPDGNESPPLEQAIAYDQPAAVGVLLAHGGCLRNRQGSIQAVFNTAVDYKAAATVAFLLHRGADANWRDAEGQTPLMRLCDTEPHYDREGNAVQTAAVLLRAGARMDMVDQQGNAALHYARQHQNERMLTLLKHATATECPAVPYTH